MVLNMLETVFKSGEPRNCGLIHIGEKIRTYPSNVNLPSLMPLRDFPYDFDKAADIRHWYGCLRWILGYNKAIFALILIW